MKSQELENKMENIAKLNKELEKRQRQNDEEIDKLRRSTQELRKEFDYTATSKRSRLGAILQEARHDTQPSRGEELRDNLEFREAANNLKETELEGETFEQSRQKNTSETSIQADIQPSVGSKTSSKHKSQAVSPSVSGDSAEVADTLGKTSAKMRVLNRVDKRLLRFPYRRMKPHRSTMLVSH